MTVLKLCLITGYSLTTIHWPLDWLAKRSKTSLLKWCPSFKTLQFESRYSFCDGIIYSKLANNGLPSNWQGSFCACTQPMRDKVTMYHHPPLAGCIHKMITEQVTGHYHNWRLQRFMMAHCVTRATRSHSNLGICCEIDLRWMPQYLTDEKSISVEVIVGTIRQQAITFLH